MCLVIQIINSFAEGTLYPLFHYAFYGQILPGNEKYLSPYFTEKRDPTQMKNRHKKNLYVHGRRDNFAFGTPHNLYSTDLHWGFALRVTQMLAFSDTPTKRERKAPTRGILYHSGI